MVARFQADETASPPLFVLSLNAGGTGLTLTAANYVVHVDRWWNPAVEDQATDRAHRIGQARPVTVVRLVAQGTIEDKVALLKKQKRVLADAIVNAAIGDPGGSVGGMTREDVDLLLGDAEVAADEEEDG